MAYRFDGVDDRVAFAIAPFSGYSFGSGGGTLACYVKRTTTGVFHYVMAFANSGGGDQEILYVRNTNVLGLLMGGLADGPIVSSSSVWYLLAATFSGSGTVRFHVHDGTSWSHANGGTVSSYTVAGTDRLGFGDNPAGSAPFAGDAVCAGIKKGNSSDAAIETLSRTAFQSWRDFGFDWLIGFDSSLEAAGVLQDQASPGTGDEIAITGTTAVADPPGWAWTSVAVPVADFTGTPLSGAPPLSVAFTDASANTPTSWAWTFGDGGTSTSQNPSHSYATAGTYTVALTATNAAGSNTKTRTGYVTVANPSGTMAKIKWGTGLVVTDEGSNVIRVDSTVGATGPPGPTGPPGAAGEKWFSGSGAPAGGLAGSIVGDWYLDTATGDVYEKTGASAWTLRGNLKGPTGATGAAGAAGAPGGAELAYVQWTTPVTLTASWQTLTTPLLTFDGSPIMLEFWCPYIGFGSNALNALRASFWVAGTPTGQSIFQTDTRVIAETAASTFGFPLTYKRRYTPAAGSGTVQWGAYTPTGGGLVVGAGPGAVEADWAPAYLRVTKA